MTVLNRTAISTLGNNGAGAVAHATTVCHSHLFLLGVAQTMLPIIGVLYGEKIRKEWRQQ